MGAKCFKSNSSRDLRDHNTNTLDEESKPDKGWRSDKFYGLSDPVSGIDQIAAEVIKEFHEERGR